MRRLLAGFFLGAMTLLGVHGVRPAECHPGHCHGDAVCGGGWKDYAEKREHTGPEGGTDSEGAACDDAVEELEEKLAVEAHGRCAELHPCGGCPTSCDGCKQKSPSGRITKKETRSRKRDDGRHECTVDAEVAFRCRCAGCVPKK